MIDIVIDTCTLKHAENPKSIYFEHSLDLITRMLGNNVLCTVDVGFSLVERENTSYIGLEYITHLQPGTPGFELIAHLASSSRVSFVRKDSTVGTKRYIERIIRNKKDRMFLRVAFNSVEKVLASHDFTDYQKGKRTRIKKDLDVSIVTAEEINPSI